MSETIIVSLISLAGTLGGTFGGILVSNKLTNYRIEQLEKKVEKHNTVIERTYKLEKRVESGEKELDKLGEIDDRTHKLEQDVAVLGNREKVSEHRIDDLEKN